MRSLIDGVAAIATAQIGDLVGPTTLLTTVSQVDPIRAYFSLSEQEYLASPAGSIGRLPLERCGRRTAAPADARRRQRVPADRHVPRRRSRNRSRARARFAISASFPNPEHTLRPGQYGRVRAETRRLTNALLVPQRAVTELQGASQLRRVARPGGRSAVTRR